MKILVADDSPLTRTILTDYLSTEGYEVYPAGTYQEAEKLFLQYHPGIIIKDLYMPESDALDSIRFFKTRDAKVKIVICTTNSSKAMLLEALKAGAQDFLLKPIDKNQVLSLVKRLS